MTLPEKQITAVIGLPGPKRYSHFIKQVVDRGSAWGLYDDGWALYGTETGAPHFPLWPAPEYAALCAVGDWATYRPREIPVQSLLDELIPSLRERETQLVVFPLVSGKGVTPDLATFQAHLRNELSRIQ